MCVSYAPEPTLAVSVRASYPHRLGDGSSLGPCPRIRGPFVCALVSASVCSLRGLFACVLSWVEILKEGPSASDKSHEEIL